jgi:hypothetical protein
MIDDQFDKWTQQWDKALADGVFGSKDTAKPESKDKGAANFFGQTNISDSDAEAELESSDVDYWNNVVNYSESESLLTEEKKESAPEVVDMFKSLKNPQLSTVKSSDPVEDMADLIEKTKKMNKSQNPVDYMNTGKDSKLKVTNGWSSGEELESLIDLKKKLHELQASLTSKETLDQKTDTASKEIEKVLSMIDKVSDSMGNRRFKSEPS